MNYVEQIIKQATKYNYDIIQDDINCLSVDSKNKFPVSIQLITPTAVKLNLNIFEWSRQCMLTTVYMRSNNFIFNIQAQTKFAALTQIRMTSTTVHELISITHTDDKQNFTTFKLLNYLKLKSEQEKLMNWINDV